MSTRNTTDTHSRLKPLLYVLLTLSYKLALIAITSALCTLHQPRLSLHTSSSHSHSSSRSSSSSMDTGYYELLDDAFRSIDYRKASAFVAHMYTELARVYCPGPAL